MRASTRRIPQPARSASHGEVERERSTRRPTIHAPVAYATSSTGIAASRSATPNGMPTSVTSARMARSGAPIAIATPHPTLAPRRSRTARSAACSAPGASHTSRAPTISVDTETASHHPSMLTQPHPLAASAQSSLLTLPPTLAPGASTGRSSP